MLLAYHFLTTLIIIVGYPFVRLIEGKNRFEQRIGLNIPNLAPTRKGRVWVHALSVGDILSAISLGETLRNRHPPREIVLTVKRATGLQVAREKVRVALNLIGNGGH